MKLVLGIGAVLIIIILIIYFLGTKPATQKEIKSESTQIQPKEYKQYDKPSEMIIDANKTLIATINTSKGKLVASLFAKETPKTVNNFVFLAREHFYDGVIFHRIIKDFMVQTGDPKGDGTGGPGYKFDDEPITRDYLRGTLAMANSGPNTNGSQFFIIHKDYQLPKQYTIFGKIDENDTESLKTLDIIADTPVESSKQGESSQPKEKIIIQTITIDEK